MPYSITMPPVNSAFQLPSRDDLLSLRRGDFVKLLFDVDDGETGERMWVQLADFIDYWEWQGVLDSEPCLLPLERGEPIRFHPLAVIQFERLADIADEIDKSRLFT